MANWPDGAEASVGDDVNSARLHVQMKSLENSILMDLEGADALLRAIERSSKVPPLHWLRRSDKQRCREALGVVHPLLQLLRRRGSMRGSHSQLQSASYGERRQVPGLLLRSG